VTFPSRAYCAEHSALLPKLLHPAGAWHASGYMQHVPLAGSFAYTTTAEQPTPPSGSTDAGHAGFASHIASEKYAFQPVGAWHGVPYWQQAPEMGSLAQVTMSLHTLPGGIACGAGHRPASTGPASTRQALSVQTHCPPSVHEHVLHPSSDGLLSPGLHTAQAVRVQSHSPLAEQEHVLQSTCFVSPAVHPVHAFCVHSHACPVLLHVQVLHPSSAALVSPGRQVTHARSEHSHAP
jgi:hypothetical protein